MATTTKGLRSIVNAIDGPRPNFQFGDVIAVDWAHPSLLGINPTETNLTDQRRWLVIREASEWCHWGLLSLSARPIVSSWVSLAAWRLVEG